jgi:hypothetical protein
MDRFLDRDGRLVIWPARRRDRLELLAYIRMKFDSTVVYSEREVNQVLREWHAWNDPAQLRRMMFDEGFLDRTLDGSKYWRKEDG